MTKHGREQSGHKVAAGPDATRDAAFLGIPHDHDHCIETALSEAEAHCAARQARFTSLRRRVLEIVWSSHQPLGAYTILQSLAEDGRQPAPPTVYRALDFLQEHGLVHRIASLNAFVGCPHPGHVSQGQFLICTQCASTVELVDPDIETRIRASAATLGFSVNGCLVEVTGLCPNCRNLTNAPAAPVTDPVSN
jgi:Fur family zinc uptake transcriptional regulator